MTFITRSIPIILCRLGMIIFIFYLTTGAQAVESNGNKMKPKAGDVNTIEQKNNYHFINRGSATPWQVLLPEQMFKGYWAATNLINNNAVVLKQNPDGDMFLYKYHCNRPYLRHVGVKADNTVRMRLIATPDTTVHNVYSYEQHKIFSQLQKIRVIGNILELEQVIPMGRLTEVLPLTYLQRKTLTPICNHDKRKK